MCSIIIFIICSNSPIKSALPSAITIQVRLVSISRRPPKCCYPLLAYSIFPTNSSISQPHSYNYFRLYPPSSLLLSTQHINLLSLSPTLHSPDAIFSHNELSLPSGASQPFQSHFTDLSTSTTNS